MNLDEIKELYEGREAAADFITWVKAFRYKEAEEQRNEKERQEIVQLKKLVGEEE